MKMNYAKEVYCPSGHKMERIPWSDPQFKWICWKCNFRLPEQIEEIKFKDFDISIR